MDDHGAERASPVRSPVTIETITMRQISIVRFWAIRNSKAAIVKMCDRAQASLGSNWTTVERICEILNRYGDPPADP